jgi:hypothetical protein
LIYRLKANSLEGSGSATGELVEAGAAFISPGRKNDAGETLWLALMPLQPELHRASAISIASHRKLPFNLTCPV